MFPRWSPTFLIFFWLVRILTMMDWWLNPGAFSLVLVEKSFLAIFSANHKVRLFLLFKTCVNLPGNFEIRPISQVEALHQLLVDHGILGSNPQRSPSPTSAGEVMLPKLWRFVNLNTNYVSVVFMVCFRQGLSWNPYLFVFFWINMILPRHGTKKMVPKDFI